MEDTIKSQFDQNIKLHKFSKEQLASGILQAANLVIQAYKKGNKLLLCGNGGSAADAQHIAAELVGRFKKERKALPAIALTTDTSIITAVANDYSYDSVFARQIEALGKKGDVLIGISTSGNSVNVIKAIETAKSKELKTIGFLGRDGGNLKDIVEIPLVVPAQGSDRIQEIHILIGHIICGLIESNFCPDGL